MRVAATILICCVSALLALGFVMLYSCSLGQAGAKYLVSQLLWCAIGLVPCAAAATLDYRTLRRVAWPLYIITIILLAMVFVPPLGVWAKGAYRWVKLGPVRFQPSELAKIALIVVMAVYCERHQRHIRCWKNGVIYPVLILVPVLALIYQEPDRGTTILLAGVSGIMLVVAGVRLHYIGIPGAAAAVALAFSLMNDPMRSKRIFSWLNIEEHKTGVGYQPWQAMLALGSGGWLGVGLGNSTQKLGLVPDRHTDFILSIIGEEFGALGTLLVLATYLTIFLTGIYISFKATDSFGSLLATGITFLIGCQAFINIGVVTSFLPTKGLPLPFVSYGGSSLMIMLTCLGILLSVALHASPGEVLSKHAAEDEDFPSDNPFSARPGPAKS